MKKHGYTEFLQDCSAYFGSFTAFRTDLKQQRPGRVPPLIPTTVLPIAEQFIIEHQRAVARAYRDISDEPLGRHLSDKEHLDTIGNPLALAIRLYFGNRDTFHSYLDDPNYQDDNMLRITDGTTRLDKMIIASSLDCTGQDIDAIANTCQRSVAWVRDRLDMARLYELIGVDEYKGYFESHPKKVPSQDKRLTDRPWSFHVKP
jgi:hypothetical protein